MLAIYTHSKNPIFQGADFIDNYFTAMTMGNPVVSTSFSLEESVQRLDDSPWTSEGVHGSVL